MRDARAEGLDARALVAVRRFVQRVSSDYGAATALEDLDGAVEGPGAPGAVGSVCPGLDGHAPADLVVSFDPPSRADRWAEYLAGLAGLARKAMIVVVPNPERLGAPGVRRPGRDTAALAPVLWAAGRVREHAYLVVPAAVSLAAGTTHDGAYQAPVGRLVRRTARLHAFVLDVRPRTPQGRRRLRTAA